MQCAFCGKTYTEEEGRSTCASCALGPGCRKFKCPNCGYETPEDLQLVKRWRAWKEKQAVKEACK